MTAPLYKVARTMALSVACVAFFLLAASIGISQTSAGSTATPAQGAAAAQNAATGKSPAQLAGLYVYPQKSQDAALQGKDEGECFDSAKQNTGFDPTAPAAAAPQSAQAPKGGAAKGGAKGAAGGAAIGAITGDAGTGAAVGATVGAAAGRRKQKQAQKQAQQQAQQTAQSQQSQQLDGFRRAMSACLDARGYSVK